MEKNLNNVPDYGFEEADDVRTFFSDRLLKEDREYGVHEYYGMIVAFLAVCGEYAGASRLRNNASDTANYHKVEKVFEKIRGKDYNEKFDNLEKSISIKWRACLEMISKFNDMAQKVGVDIVYDGENAVRLFSTGEKVSFVGPKGGKYEEYKDALRRSEMRRLCKKYEKRGELRSLQELYKEAYRNLKTPS